MTSKSLTREEFNLKAIAVPVFGPSLLFGLGEGAILPVVALSAIGLGASVAIAALVVTLIGVGSLLSNIPASLVTARYGERSSILAAAGWGALAMFLCAVAPDIWVFAAAIFMIGMSSSVFNLARQNYLTEAVPVHFRARALSTLGGTMRIGIFIGPFAGAGLIHLLGLAGAYWVALAALLLAGVVAAFMPDLPAATTPTGAAAGPTAMTATPTAAAVPTAAAAAPKPARRMAGSPDISAIIRVHARTFLTVGVGVLLVSAVRASRQVVIPLWGENIGLQATVISLVYGVSGAIDMLIFYPAGKVMDRRGRAWVAVPSMLLMGLALLLMPLTTGTVSLLLVALLIGFGNGIGSGLIMTLGAGYSPSLGRPRFLGIWRFLSDLGTTAGPGLLAGITALVSLAAGIWATGVVGLAAAAVLWYWIPRARPLAPN